MYSLNLKTAPTVEPITTEEAKSYLRVDHATDDVLIDRLIQAAREHAEGLVLRRALITQTWTVYLDAFPLMRTARGLEQLIYVPLPPLQAVNSIKYLDSAGVQQTWAASKYRVDTNHEPGRITPAWTESWPSAREQTGSIEIEIDAGYGDAAADVPQLIKQGMLYHVAHMYENREEVLVGQGLTAMRLPEASERCYAQFRAEL